MNRYSLTYDFGSGSVKAALVDGEHHIAAAKSQAYNTYFPRKDWAVQKPQELWSAMVTATREVMRVCGARPEDIKGIAISHTATTIIFTDKDGNAVSDCVMWMDGRAGKQAEEINSILGSTHFGGKNVISKLLWFSKNRPELIEKAYAMLDVAAYLIHRLTGEFMYEFTGARATCLLDVDTRQWMDERFEAAQFPKRLIPQKLITTTERAGGLTAVAAEELGLMAGTPVFGGCSDHATAVLGTGGTKPGDAHIYIGTSAWLIVCTAGDDPNKGPMPSPVPGMRYHFYSTDSGGDSIEYLIRTYFSHEKELGENVYDRIAAAIEDRSSVKDVLFLPFLTGASAPVSDTTVRASLLNISADTTREDIARAVVEGIGFNLRLMMDYCREETGITVKCLRGVGGGLQTPGMVQAITDILNVPVEIVREPRFSGNIGLAVAVETGLGEHPGGFSALDEIIKPEAVYMPRQLSQERYDRLYKAYKSSFYALKSVYNQLNGGESV